MAAPKPKPTPKRSWWYDKKHVVHCYSSPRDDCHYHIVAVPSTSDIYDAELGRATKRINGILEELSQQNRPARRPSLIIVDSRPFLAWTQPSRGGPDEPGVLGPDDKPATLTKALQLDVTGGRRRRPRPPKPKKRAYIIGGTGNVYCYPNDRGGCVLSRLWESAEVKAGSFHDSDMADATLQVNAVLDFVGEGQGQSTSPSFIVIGGALGLVWTEPGLGPDDDPQDIRQALGLSR